MHSRKVLALIVFLAVLASGAQPLEAYWQPNGNAVCTYTGDQQTVQVATDGAAGVILAWIDARSGINNVYTQRINGAGTTQWAVGGVVLYSSSGAQIRPQLISDGTGGAFFVWTDHRGSDYDIYAQRVDASGNKLWNSNGVAICAATGDQVYPQLVSDGAGGAIIVWQDNRSGNNDIYVQRINSAGVPQWGFNGLGICTTTDNQTNPCLIADGSGGAIAAWEDQRGGSYHIYVQRVNSSGGVAWTVNGVALSSAAGDGLDPQIVADGSSGAVVAWHDTRSGGYDIYARRINALGTPLWTANGVAICTALNDQVYPAIVPDGAGGAIITWQDFRSGTNYDIYNQRVNSAGTVLWGANGALVCGAVGDQMHPQLIIDSSGATIIAWEDPRNGSTDIYAQRVSVLGGAFWATDGVAVCNAPLGQYLPRLVADGTKGAIIAWQDLRNGANYDIYAQQTNIYGQSGYLAPAIHSIRDVPGDQGGKVNLAWDASRYDSYGEITRYTIWRALKTPSALAMLHDGATLLAGPEEVAPTPAKGALRIEQAAGRKFYWQLIDEQDAYYFDAYSKIVATAFDSTSVSQDYEYFEVVAHTSDASRFYVSSADSGYSVDNLSPTIPKALAGKQSFTPVGLDMTWDHNTEADLAHYAVYRGTSAGFVPGAGNLIASPTDTATFDSGWRWSSGYYYKVSAIDIHGNESLWAVLTPDAVTGTETPKAPAASYLAQNYPNPFNPTTRIEFGLSAPGHVSLRIYDVAGRLVRALVNDERLAGGYDASWDGRDSSGLAVASGIYFYRLNAGAFESTKKMILVR